METAPPIAGELAAFLASGLSIVLATRDAQLQPGVAVALAASAGPDGGELAIFLREEDARRALAHLQEHPELAACFDLPSTHRSCQLKGRYLGHRPATPDERPELERQLQAFRDDLATIGIPHAMTAAWRAWPAVALRMRVSDVFEQTPGPGAGERLP